MPDPISLWYNRTPKSKTHTHNTPICQPMPGEKFVRDIERPAKPNHQNRTECGLVAWEHKQHRGRWQSCAWRVLYMWRRRGWRIRGSSSGHHGFPRRSLIGKLECEGHVWKDAEEHTGRDTLHTTTTRKTTDRRLCDALDVITKNLAVTLCSTLAEALATFSACEDALDMSTLRMKTRPRSSWMRYTYVQSWW